MAAGEGMMEIKARATSLFRDGDYLGAAASFRRVIDAIHQISSTSVAEASKYANLELACLCNLAFAYIKAGSMEKAEEASSLALERWPSCAKALYRRGQARLALGRPVGAATDFRNVLTLEPTNAQVTKMLRHAQEVADRDVIIKAAVKADQRGDTRDDDGQASKVSTPRSCAQGKTVVRDANLVECDAPSPDAESTISHRDYVSESETIAASMSRQGGPTVPTDSKEINKSDKVENEKQTPGTASSTSPSVSSYMVSGWLASAEREHVEHPHESSNRTTIDHKQLDVTDASPAGVKVESGGRGDASVSRLVTQLTVGKVAKEEEAQCNSRAIAHSEWSRLQIDEIDNIQVLRRLSGGSQAEKGTKAVGRRVDERRNSADRKKSRSANHSPSVGGGVQTSEWIALEDEEEKVRGDFRAKLGIGKKKKKKSNVSRLRAEVPP